MFAVRKDGLGFRAINAPDEVGQDEVFSESVPVPSLDLVKKIVWERIKAERDRRTETGGYKVGTKWFHSDQKSRSQQLGLVLLGDNIPADLQWKTMDGSFVTMTPQLARQILDAAIASDQAIFAAAEAHRAAMEASSDPAIYDFSVGWPPNYADERKA
jgi:hypothetical protein